MSDFISINIEPFHFCYPENADNYVLKQLLLTNEFHSLSRSCLRSTAFMHLRTRGHITVRLVAMTQPQYEEDIRSINRYSEQNGENGFVITITHSISLKT